MVKKIVKKFDDRLLNEALRRSIIHGRRFQNARAKSTLGRTHEAFKREHFLPKDDFIYNTAVPRFIGGTTGRSGTKWLITLLREHLQNDPVIIGEHGAFTLGILRNAPYEYYQLGGGDIGRASYVEFFLKQVRTYLFRRRLVYTGALKGLIRYILARAIDIAGENLKKDLPKLQTYPEISHRFGQFYLHLLNYHAAVMHGSASGWINKEPPYGRHADELINMVPNARLLVLARDGRASALSMLKKGWRKDIRAAMDRWGRFAKMTFEAIDRCPAENIQVVKYEDMVLNFESSLYTIFRHFQLPEEKIPIIVSSADSGTGPRSSSVYRWQNEIEANDLRWFEKEYGDVMERAGYTL
ncbi:MAG: sulfotransferase [Spirochaetaceae bacterium]|nr:sulfotransferase [Spirochaetaceae bacterium]MCF7949356.1 sulfotransferase [Spirochaetia bacterium]